MSTIQATFTINITYNVPEDMTTEDAYQAISDNLYDIADNAYNNGLFSALSDLEVESYYAVILTRPITTSKRVYWVDVPDAYAMIDPAQEAAPFINVATFFTWEEALDFAKGEYGADDNGCISLISMGEAVEDNEEEAQP